MRVIEYVPTEDFFIQKHTLKKPQNEIHYHHAYEIYYVIDGEREYFIGDQFFSVSSGDLVWVPKDMLHRTDGKGATRFLLFFKDVFIHKYLSEAAAQKLVSREPFVFRPDDNVKTEFTDMFYELLKEYNKNNDSEEMCDELVLLRYLSELLYFIHSHENCYNEAPDKPNARMHLIVKYINDHYADDISINEIADIFGITPNHFCHVFTKHMGVTFTTYLNTVRIKAAADMIKKDKDTILEISGKCGFSSSHYFYRVFKSEKGLSPSEYRAKFRTK